MGRTPPARGRSKEERQPHDPARSGETATHGDSTARGTTARIFGPQGPTLLIGLPPGG